jgi:hypothetical protein
MVSLRLWKKLYFRDHVGPVRFFPNSSYINAFYFGLMVHQLPCAYAPWLRERERERERLKWSYQTSVMLACTGEPIYALNSVYFGTGHVFKPRGDVRWLSLSLSLSRVFSLSKQSQSKLNLHFKMILTTHHLLRPDIENVCTCVSFKFEFFYFLLKLSTVCTF